MLSITNQTLQRGYISQEKTSLVKKFITWTKNQEENRLFWLGLSIVGHGCVLTPLAVSVVMLTGLNFSLYMAAFSSMAMALIVNLAALPTKITIPVLLFSVVIDLIVMASALTMGISN